MNPLEPLLSCAGCGRALAPDTPLPFRCLSASSRNDTDHVVKRRGPKPDMVWPDSTDPNPFIRYRTLLYSWRTAQRRGMSDVGFVALASALDAAVMTIEGKGFTVTPYRQVPRLRDELGLGESGGLWVKDETGNVSGSHKARHLMAIAIYLEVAEETGLLRDPDAQLAIASCGNAALAAAVVARAANRPLRVFIPPSAHPAVVSQLQALEAEIEVCERRDDDPPGDPCYLRFSSAVADGALPFTVQGNENGLTVEGGMLLAWELISQHAEAGAPPLDRVVIQVGGGALASGCIQGFRWAHALGAVPRMPIIHAVQSEASHPLVDAWQRIKDAGPDIAATIEHAARNRSQYMKPVDQPGQSVATGILDDETYDWLEIVRGMNETQGWPIAVSEETLIAAHKLGNEAAGISAEATGTAGLAGVLGLRDKGVLRDGEQVAVLFTGVER